MRDGMQNNWIHMTAIALPNNRLHTDTALRGSPALKPNPQHSWTMSMQPIGG